MTVMMVVLPSYEYSEGKNWLLWFISFFFQFFEFLFGDLPCTTSRAHHCVNIYQGTCLKQMKQKKFQSNYTFTTTLTLQGLSIIQFSIILSHTLDI